MIDSERGTEQIRVPVRGNGVTSLGGHAQGFRHVLYEGGKPWEREAFDWNVCLRGSDRTGGNREKPLGIEGVPKDIKHRRPSDDPPSVSTHFHPESDGS